MTDEELMAALSADAPAASSGGYTDEELVAMLSGGSVTPDVGQVEEAPSNWMSEAWGAVKDFTPGFVKDYAGAVVDVNPYKMVIDVATGNAAENQLVGAATSGMQGLTLGGSDELIGGLAAAVGSARNTLGGNPAEFANRYRQYRDLARSIQGKYAEEHPLQSTLYEFAGAMAGPGKLIGMTGAPASALGRLATFGATGAAEGAAAGYGYSTAEDTGEQLADAAGGAAMGLAFAPLSAVLSRGAGRALGGDADAIAAMENQRVRPTAGMAGGPAVGWFEETLGMIPGGAGVVRTAREQSLEDMGDAVRRASEGDSKFFRELKDEAGNVTGLDVGKIPLQQFGGAAEAGEAIRARMQTALKNFRDKASKRYNKVDELIPSGTRMPATNFQSKLDRITGVFDDNEELGQTLLSPLVKRMKSAVSGKDTLSYAQLAQLRTEIGDAAFGGQSHLLTDSSTKELRDLYGALTDDLKLGAKAVGPEAEKALEEANEFWRKGRERFDAVDWVEKAATPEDVWRRYEQSVRAGPTRIDEVNAAMGKKHDPEVESLRQALGAFRMREMGMATPGRQDATGMVYSPRTFLTEYNRYAPDAQGQPQRAGRLFEHNDPPLQDLLKIADAEKAARLSENVSGTARGVVSASTLAAPLISLATGNPMGAGAGAAAAAIGGSYGLAHMLESPATIAGLKRLAKDRKLGASSIQQSPTTRFIYEGLLQAGVDPNDEEGLDNYLRQFIR